MKAQEAWEFTMKAWDLHDEIHEAKIVKATPKAQKYLPRVIEDIKAAAYNRKSVLVTNGVGFFNGYYTRYALGRLLIGLGYDVRFTYDDKLKISWKPKDKNNYAEDRD